MIKLCAILNIGFFGSSICSFWFHLVPQEIYDGDLQCGNVYNNYMSRQNYEQQLRKQINDLDNQIYDLQTYYLQNTRDSGNLIKGFDNYLNARAPRNLITKKPKIENIERIFSLTSVRSKTSQAYEDAYIGEKHDSNQVVANKRNRIRNTMKGKGFGREESLEENSVSADNGYSLDESSNNKMRKKKNRIPTAGKGTRK